MPDFVIRHIDSLLAERILALARDRQWSVNDVVLGALRRGLGMSLPGTATSSSTLQAVDGLPEDHWDAQETAAFQAAMQALALAEPPALAVPLADGDG